MSSHSIIQSSSYAIHPPNKLYPSNREITNITKTAQTQIFNTSNSYHNQKTPKYNTKTRKQNKRGCSKWTELDLFELILDLLQLLNRKNKLSINLLRNIFFTHLHFLALISHHLFYRINLHLELLT